MLTGSLLFGMENRIGTAQMIERMQELGKPVFIWQRCGFCRGTGQVAVVQNAVMTGEAVICPQCENGFVSADAQALDAERKLL